MLLPARLLTVETETALEIISGPCDDELVELCATSIAAAICQPAFMLTLLNLEALVMETAAAQQRA